MSNFKGIKQVLFSEYSGKSQSEKIGYLWLVANVDGNGAKIEGSYDIYFGSRKYSENGIVYHNLINTFGELMDENGAFILPITKDFTSFDESNVDSISDILYALDVVVKKNADDLAKVYTQSQVNNLIDGLNTTIASCVKNVKVKVDEQQTFDGTFADGTVTIDLSNAFAAAGKVKDVKVDNVTVVENGIANITLTGKADKSTVTALAERVEALEGFDHADEIVYDSESKTIYLTADGEKLGNGFSAADFFVDGMLDSVDFEVVDGVKTNNLVFTFNTEAGKESFTVDFSKYVDTYHADGETIVLDSATNTFSVNEVDASKTKLTEDITIAGGPLANNVIETGDEWPWKDDAGNKIIPSGKSMEEILTGLFLKVIDGTVEWGNASWSPSLNNPTITLSSNGPVEVGSKVKVSTLAAGAATAGSRSATCECTQGYFLADADGNPTDEHISGNKTISVNASITGTPTLTCTWNGNSVDISVNTTELVVEEGKNTISVSQSGQSATCDALPTTKVFAATNTKSLLSSVSATFSEDKPSDKPLTSSNVDTINAYYPIYTNGVKGSNGTASSETTLVANDGTKLPLVADSTAFYVNFAPMIDGGTGYRLLVKKGKTITEAMALNTLNSKYEVDMKSSFVKASTTVNKASGDSEIEYDVYESKGSAGANALRFKIE